MLKEHKINIAVCKTRLDENVHPIFANHILISKDRNRQGGGVAILVEKRLRVSIIQDAYIEQLCTRNDIEFILSKIWLGLDAHLYLFLI